MPEENANIDQPIEDTSLTKKPYTKPILSIIDLGKSGSGTPGPHESATTAAGS